MAPVAVVPPAEVVVVVVEVVDVDSVVVPWLLCSWDPCEALALWAAAVAWVEAWVDWHVLYGAARQPAFRTLPWRGITKH